MNETLKEIYSLAFTQWPLVAAAYAVAGIVTETRADYGDWAVLVLNKTST